MPVNVPTDLCPSQEFHVVRTREQSHVINLRNTRNKELDRAGDQVLISTASQSVVESAIHLIEVKVVRSRTRSLSALVVTAGVDRFYKSVDFVRSKETGFAFPVRAHINDTDAIVGIEYGDGIMWSNCKPVGKGSGIAREKRMQYQRRKCEIVDPIDLARDFHLLQMVAVNFDQDFHPEPMGFLRKRLNKAKGLRNHETAGSGFLDGIADSIEPNQTDAGGLKPAEDGYPDTLRPADGLRRYRSAAK